MKAVKFVQDASPYMAGEYAGFDEKTAAELVKSGVAEDASKEQAAAQAEHEKLVAEREAMNEAARAAARSAALAAASGEVATARAKK